MRICWGESVHLGTADLENVGVFFFQTGTPDVAGISLSKSHPWGVYASPHIHFSKSLICCWWFTHTHTCSVNRKAWRKCQFLPLNLLVMSHLCFLLHRKQRAIFFLPFLVKFFIKLLYVPSFFIFSFIPLFLWFPAEGFVLLPPRLPSLHPLRIKPADKS